MLYHVIGKAYPNRKTKIYKNIAKVSTDTALPEGWEYICKHVSVDTAHWLLNVLYASATRPKIP